MGGQDLVHEVEELAPPPTRVVALPNLPANDAALLRRWLTALGLLATAEALGPRGDDASSSTALIAGDAACEALLGVLGTWSALHLKPEPKYNELLDRAIDATTKAKNPIGGALLADLRTTHATRNTVVHHGATANSSQAALACQCARRLLGLLASVSTTFGSLQAGVGIVGAIASLMTAPTLTEQLVLGEAAVAAGQASGAADAATRAHTELLFRLDPPIGRGHPGRLSSSDAKELGRARNYLEELGNTVAELQGWVSASALGMDPVTYRRLRSTLGLHVQYMGGNDSIRREREPTLEESRWALTTVAEMAFRLWQLGGLVEGTQEDAINARYGLRS